MILLCVAQIKSYSDDGMEDYMIFIIISCCAVGIAINIISCMSALHYYELRREKIGMYVFMCSSYNTSVMQHCTYTLE